MAKPASSSIGCSQNDDALRATSGVRGHEMPNIGLAAPEFLNAARS
jgi:hypothetical protein